MRTPISLLYSKSPRNDHARTFGCVAYVRILKANRKFKFEDRSTLQIYVELRNGLHHVNIPGRRALVTTKHVLFYETLFRLESEENIGLQEMSHIKDIEPQHNCMGVMRYPSMQFKRYGTGSNEGRQTSDYSANEAEKYERVAEEKHWSIDEGHGPFTISLGTTESRYLEQNGNASQRFTRKALSRKRSDDDPS